MNLLLYAIFVNSASKGDVKRGLLFGTKSLSGLPTAHTHTLLKIIMITSPNYDDNLLGIIYIRKWKSVFVICT